MNEPQRLITRPMLIALLAIGFLGVAIYALKGILTPILLAFLLAYAFDPLADLLERHRVPRAAAAGVCLLLLLLVLGGLLALILPTLQEEFQSIARRIPGYLEKIQQSAIPWLEQHLGVHLPDTLDEALASAREQISSRAERWAGPAAQLFSGMLAGTFSLLLSLIYVILVPLFIFYFLKDFDTIIDWLGEQVPPRHQQRIAGLAREIDQVLAGFLRGQLMVVTILAVVYSIALSLAGVPAAITIAIIAGLFNVVPYLGTTTGVTLSMLFLLLEGAGWNSYLIVGSIFTVVSVCDGLFLTPKVLGSRLGLSPVMVILAILVFGELFGFLGVLLAVPVSAVGKVLIRQALGSYRRSRAFLGPVDSAAPDPSGRTS